MTLHKHNLQAKYRYLNESKQTRVKEQLCVGLINGRAERCLTFFHSSKLWYSTLCYVSKATEK